MAPDPERHQQDSLSMDFVHAIAFGPRNEVWVGTIGNGWGLSNDDGATWRNWTLPARPRVAVCRARRDPHARGDTTIILTADGAQLTDDDGAHWVAVVDSVGPAAKGPADTAITALPNEYLPASPGYWLPLAAGGQLALTAGGWTVSICRRAASPSLAAPGWRCACALRGRWGLHPGSSRRPPPSWGGAGPDTRRWAPPFARPISLPASFIDQTYRYGSTMGGNFQPHQGVEFNNPDGTPVHAIGSGVVVYAGPAEAGALTVAIRHDSLLQADGPKQHLTRCTTTTPRSR